MKLHHIIGVISLLVALILYLSGQRLVENPEGYIRDPGAVETVRLKTGHSAAEVSLRKGQSHNLIGRTNGNHFYCFAWSTEHGSDSVSVSVFLKPWSKNGSTQWRQVAPENLCQKGEHYNVTITSNRDQVIQFGWYLERAWVPVSGQQGQLCRGCGVMPTFDDLSNPNIVSAKGTSRKFVAATIGSAGMLILIGLSTILSALYRMTQLVFNSEREQVLEREVRGRRSGDKANLEFGTQASTDLVKQAKLEAELKRELEELEKANSRSTMRQDKGDGCE